MVNKLLFADASTSLDGARAVILGVPYDRTTSFRTGSRLGPNAIREASWNFEPYFMEHGREIGSVPFADIGNTEEFGPTASMVLGVRSKVSEIVRHGRIPITLGGEHSIAPACVEALPKDVGVLGIDAHLDFRDEYLGDRYSHACSARRISDHVGVPRVVYTGIRSFSREEREDLERLGLAYVSAMEVHRDGIARALDRAMKAVGRERLYLTIDIDGIDPAYAPAVGNPEPFGLSPLDVKHVINAIGPRLAGMDVNEVSPQYDHGQTAILAARLVREALIGLGTG
jgi:agmatinase